MEEEKSRMRIISTDDVSHHSFISLFPTIVQNDATAESSTHILKWSMVRRLIKAMRHKCNDALILDVIMANEQYLRMYFRRILLNFTALARS